MQADALVVGAGPAGAMAALVLARAGVTVRIVDRAEFPRDKLCGDTLNPGSLAILDRHGIGARVRERALAIRGMTVTGPGNASVSADYPDELHGAALTRRDLDTILLEAAVDAGAEFTPGVAVRAPLLGPAKAGHYVPNVRSVRLQPDRDGPDVRGVRLQPDPDAVTGVRIAASGREHDWPARVVIAADGRHSTLAFALGLANYAASPRRWAFGTYYTGVSGGGPYGEMHVRADGYIGVAPLPGDLTNLCVVRELRNNPIASASRMNAEDTIASAIASDPWLRERFAAGRQVSPITVLGPLAVEARAAGCPGLLLAGDAAGFIDPMTGDGMRFALRGGELAAEAALRELQSGVPAFQHLQAARAREFSGKWRVNRALRALVASPRGVSLAASVAARWSAPVRLLIGIAGDVKLCR